MSNYQSKLFGCFIFAWAVSCIFRSDACAQPLSNISEGDISVGVSLITRNLDIVFDGTLQSTPSDYAVIPGSGGRAFVSTLGGVIRVVERDGTVLPAFIDTRDDPIASEVEWDIGDPWGCAFSRAHSAVVADVVADLGAALHVAADIGGEDILGVARGSDTE